VTVPPDDSSVVTRTRAARAVPVAVGTAAACLVVVALLGYGVRTDFGPQLRLDGIVSEPARTTATTSTSRCSCRP
jgi:undecaprenyl-diphosphatase